MWIPTMFMIYINTLISDSVLREVRFTLTVAVMIIMFLVSAVLTQVDTDYMQEEFFAITMVVLVIHSCATGLYQAVVDDLAG